MSEKIPEKIYLQWDDDLTDVTWCSDKINSDDVEYVRASPKHETPEAYKQRTGKDYPDDAPVWKIMNNLDWVLTVNKCYNIYNDPVVIANEHGKPPADWKPE